ncbi:MAG TPA: DNA cytosine methyltransferase, partial [Nocardioidaceae bacterium]|nr:DNA cytosine methyltransferase [Nocardioidaceae bacterium]
MSLTGTDLFAGAGGSTTGVIQIPGVHVTIAANHSAVACAIHNANHPTTDHAIVDLHEEDPRFFPKTDFLWASPECTKWSKAGAARYASVSLEATLLDDDLIEDPDAAVAQRSRLLMFDVLRFIEHHRYRLVFVENVTDIATSKKYAYAWQVWKRSLRKLGYKFRVISVNSMHAQAFGAPAPQSRDRLYVAAWPENEAAPDFERILRPQAYCSRCDAMVESQQAWKNGRTVGKYRDQYVYIHGACGTIVEPGYLPAYDIVDWSIPGTPIGDRLAPKTMLRVAAGVARYWGQPFHYEHGGNQYDAADPRHPQHLEPNAYYRVWPIDEELRTLHTA